MIKDDVLFKGEIHRDFKKKVLLKLNLILALILVPPAIFSSLTAFDIINTPSGKSFFENFVGPPGILLTLILSTLAIVWIIILIISSIGLSKFIKNFSYNVSEDHIVIQRGLFTTKKVTIPYIRIQNINVINGFFDKRYKLYTVKLETAGKSGTLFTSSGINFHSEGYIPGIKDPDIIEEKINELMKKHSQVQIPQILEEKLFKPEELAFDNFISYILSKLREGEKLKTRIKELRESKNLTLSKLAEMVGVPIQTIEYLEEGRYNPSLSLALKISKVLDCKIEELFQLT